MKRPLQINRDREERFFAVRGIASKLMQELLTMVEQKQCRKAAVTALFDLIGIIDVDRYGESVKKADDLRLPTDLKKYKKRVARRRESAALN